MKQGYRVAYYKQGQAALIATVFFLLVSLAILGSISIMSTTHLGRARELVYARNSYTTAESGLEDAIYRVVNFMAIDSNDPTYPYLNKAKATVDIPLAISGTRTITSRGSLKNRFRAVQATFSVSATNGIPFTSALNAGFLGVRMAGNTTITHVDFPAKVGNVFSNGSIDASGGTGDLITGNATVARPVANDLGNDNLVDVNLTDFGQRNSDPAIDALDTPEIPLNFITFHDDATRSDIGQSFVMPLTAYVVQAKVYMKKATAIAPQLHAYIIPNNPARTEPASAPFHPGSNERISEVTIQPGDPMWTDNNWKWVTFKFNVHRPAIENEKFWLVLEAEGTNYGGQQFQVGASSDDTFYTYGQNTCYGQYLWCSSTPDGYTGCAGGAPCFSQGTYKFSPDATLVNPTWDDLTSGSAQDLAFRIYIGEGTTGSVDGTPATEYITKADSIDVCGNLTANSVLGPSDVHGDIYYHNILTAGDVIANEDINNPDAPAACSEVGAQRQACSEATTGSCHDHDGINEPAPDPEGYQSTDGFTWQKAVYKWKGTATSTSIVSSKDVAGTTVLTIGPAYIDGSLRCRGNGRIQLTGVLFVKEGAKFEDDCIVEVLGADAYGQSYDGYIIVEGTGSAPYNGGKVDVIQRAKFLRNDAGLARTGYVYVYALYHRLDNFDPQEPIETIELDSNAGSGGGAFFAPFGEIRIRSNAEAITLAAPRLQVLGSAKVKYEDGVVSPIPPQGGGTISLIPSFFEFHEIE